MTDAQEPLRPTKAVRRFDVLAEFRKQERVDKGDAEDVAKGYGIFTAKFVANKSRNEPNDTTIPDAADPKWKWLNGDIQTDFEFDISVMHNMGPEFYREVFVPAIAKARADGKKYEDIRDEIRADWKPAKKKR